MDAIQALFRGEDTPTAEAGALMVVEFFGLIRSFMTSGSKNSTK